MLRKSGTQRRQPPLWRRCRSVRQVKQVHALMVLRGFLSDPSALRELLFASAVAIRGGIAHARLVFDRIPHPDRFMYNTLIRGATHSDAPRDAVSIYARMARHSGGGVRPDKLSFPFVLRACAAMGAGATGTQVHAHVVKAGCETDAFVRNAFIGMHASYGDPGVAAALFDRTARGDAVAWSAMISGSARRGDIGAARQLFDESPAKDLVSWNVMITAYAKRGEMALARDLFDRAPDRDVVSWNAMISGYVRCGSHKHAMETFEQMQCVGEKPDTVTLLSLVSACADSGDLEDGLRLHCYLSERFSRTGGLTTVLGNALIDMYAKCGSMKSALEVFWSMRDKDVSTWNSIIGGLALHGHVVESIDVFKKMLMGSIRPDEITFVSVLVACSHGGMVDKGREYFNLMQQLYRIEPNVKHYGCMVDMLRHAGLLKEAFEFIKTMKVQPNSVIWRTLLGACRIHGEIELAEYANQELLKARSDASADYVLLSNIYASAGEWLGSEKMRKLMDDSGVNKEAGHAVVDGNSKDLLQPSRQF